MSSIAYSPQVGPLEMQDGRRRAWKVMPSVYEVVSRKADRRYQVVVVDGLPCCECPAGSHGHPCWHAALVLARILREKVA